MACTGKDQYFRIKMCPFYIQSACKKGKKCTFAHDENELRVGISLRKTKICDTWKAGQCKAKHCRFAHGEAELRSTPDYFKTALCKYWLRGNCPQGAGCRHAHGDVELRNRSYRHSNSEKKSLFDTNATLDKSRSSIYSDPTDSTDSSSSSSPAVAQKLLHRPPMGRCSATAQLPFQQPSHESLPTAKWSALQPPLAHQMQAENREDQLVEFYDAQRESYVMLPAAAKHHDGCTKAADHDRQQISACISASLLQTRAAVISAVTEDEAVAAVSTYPPTAMQQLCEDISNRVTFCSSTSTTVPVSPHLSCCSPANLIMYDNQSNSSDSSAAASGNVFLPSDLSLELGGSSSSLKATSTSHLNLADDSNQSHLYNYGLLDLENYPEIGYSNYGVTNPMTLVDAVGGVAHAIGETSALGTLTSNDPWKSHSFKHSLLVNAVRSAMAPDVANCSPILADPVAVPSSAVGAAVAVATTEEAAVDKTGRRDIAVTASCTNATNTNEELLKEIKSDESKVVEQMIDSFVALSNRIEGKGTNDTVVHMAARIAEAMVLLACGTKADRSWE